MIKNLNDGDLNLKVKTLAQQERRLTREMVEHIAEVFQRKLYLKLNYDSLFAYLTKEIGYSNGSAQRRIDAAKLLIGCPEVAVQIQTGAVNLSQISKLQMISREVAKAKGQRVSLDQQKAVLQKIQNLRETATDLVLAQEFQTEIKVKPKTHVQRDESVRLEITFTKEEMEIIRAAQALLSNKTGGGLKEALVESAKRVIESHEPKTKSAANAEVRGSGRITTTVVSNRSVTPKMKRELRHAVEGCQFRDPKTDHVCGSKFFLEVDHIQPKYQGGGNERENLRMLCKSHNIYRYQKNL